MQKGTDLQLQYGQPAIGPHLAVRRHAATELSFRHVLGRTAEVASARHDAWEIGSLKSAV